MMAFQDLIIGLPEVALQVFGISIRGNILRLPDVFYIVYISQPCNGFFLDFAQGAHFS